MLRLLAYLVVLGVSSAAALTGWLWWQLSGPLALAEPRVLDVANGEGLGHVARRLQVEGVLADYRPLLIYSRATGLGRQLQAGEYAIAPGTTPLALLALLEAKRTISYQVTLVEGWTVQQALTALHAQPKLSRRLDSPQQADFWAVLGVETPLASHPEGLFFPDTYQYQKGMSDADVLLQAYTRLDRVLAEEWSARSTGLPYDTPYAALIMASVVEKETAVPAERGQIAGVFVRRLQRGMRLQTDPTVIYGLGQAFDGNLRRRHLQDAGNRYNSYRHAGLPPTPIALAGRAAIRAALHPEEGSSLYFVARGDGSHQFSRTLAEHQAAVERYQRQRRADYRSSPAREARP